MNSKNTGDREGDHQGARLVKHRLEGVFEGEADDARGHRRRADEEREACGRALGEGPALLERRLEDAQQILAVDPQDRHERREVHREVKEQGVAGDGEPLLEEEQVPGARHRQKLGETLNHAEDERFEHQPLLGSHRRPLKT
jgi:hypothetical protein